MKNLVLKRLSEKASEDPQCQKVLELMKNHRTD